MDFDSRFPLRTRLSTHEFSGEVAEELFFGRLRKQCCFGENSELTKNELLRTYAMVDCLSKCTVMPAFTLHERQQVIRAFDTAFLHAPYNFIMRVPKEAARDCAMRILGAWEVAIGRQ
jgi:hypothetical protein